MLGGGKESLRAATPVRDALVAGLVAALLFVAVLWLPVWWARAALVVGFCAFLGRLYFHPAFWYRRIVTFLLGMWGTAVAVPMLGIEWQWGPDIFGRLIVEGGGWSVHGPLALAFVASLCVCVYHETRRERSSRAEPRGPEGKPEGARPLGPRTEIQQAPSAQQPVQIFEPHGPVHISYVPPRARGPEVPEPGRKSPPPAGPRWPQPFVKPGAEKVIDHFVGREDELDQIAEAMAGDARVIAVIGLVGQGKSCLIGRWREAGGGAPANVGLLWCRPYETGYTFDRFVDDMLVYLTGELPDRQSLPGTAERVEKLCQLLRKHPCVVMLDGAERWLNRWAKDPDASPEGATPEDRAGVTRELDRFLADVPNWAPGSRLVLTSRAVPQALDPRPRVTIGVEHGLDRRLEDLKRHDAIQLLETLGVRGDRQLMQEAVEAYGCHPYALFWLGTLLREQYGGDIARWKEVNPLGSNDLSGLLDKAVAHYEGDAPLLSLVGCSLGAAPLAMLAELTESDERETRRKLAGLAKWQLVEFRGGDVADQHAVVRRHLHGRIGDENRAALLARIAHWWGGRPVPRQPQRIEEVFPCIRAIEHAVEAADIEYALDRFYSKPCDECHYVLGEWLFRYGYLQEQNRLLSAIIDLLVQLIEHEGRSKMEPRLADAYCHRGLGYAELGLLDEARAEFGSAIEIYTRLVKKEGRLECRAGLAGVYNNRGLVFRHQGRFEEAIADYERAIDIETALIEGEGRSDLRKDLALSFNNRANVYSARGLVDEAIADYDRAIDIETALIEKEGHSDLRNELAGVYNNRGTEYSRQERFEDATADLEHAIGILTTLIENEGRGELRNQLAGVYNNRGAVHRGEGRLDEAIPDMDRAIDILTTLIESEGRSELRNDLATAYSNRGNAYLDNGCVDEAIPDYDEAIDIRETLVEREGRRDLVADLESVYFNRANAHTDLQHWTQARSDIDRGGELIREQVADGHWYVLPSFLQTVTFRCTYLEDLGDPHRSAAWANDALRWLTKTVHREEVTFALSKEVPLFLEALKQTRPLLVDAGLDQALLDRVKQAFSP